MRLRVWLFTAFTAVLAGAAWVRFQVWDRLLLRLPPSRAFRRSMQAKRDTE